MSKKGWVEVAKNALEIVNLNLISAPGNTDQVLQSELIKIATAKKNAIAILDIPRTLNVSQAAQYIKNFNSKFAAFYYPYVNSISDKTILPPSAIIPGYIAHVDTAKGIYKTPAGSDPIKFVGTPEINLTQMDIDHLVQSSVNLILPISKNTSKVWGARTATFETTEFKYISPMRTYYHLQQSIYKNMDWVVFEPNDIQTWNAIRQSIYNFLTNVWRKGYLLGTNTNEAFFVKVDQTTTSQNDIQNGILNAYVGFAITMPAEFSISKITWKVSTPLDE